MRPRNLRFLTALVWLTALLSLGACTEISSADLEAARQHCDATPTECQDWRFNR